MRLVDVDEFLERLCDRDCDIVPQYSEDGYSIERIEETLNATPTVDAVQVVRCRDCIHSYYENGNGYDAGYFCLLQMYDEYEYEKVRPLGFCDMGEKDGRNNKAEN